MQASLSDHELSFKNERVVTKMAEEGDHQAIEDQEHQKIRSATGTFGIISDFKIGTPVSFLRTPTTSTSG